MKISEIATKTIELLEMLPEDDQLFALVFIKKLVLAWDPDYTKLTTAELKELEEARKDPDYKAQYEVMKELGLL